MPFDFSNFDDVTYHLGSLHDDINYPYRDAATGLVIPICDMHCYYAPDAREAPGGEFWRVSNEGSLFIARADDAPWRVNKFDLIAAPVFEDATKIRFYRSLCNMTRAQCADFVGVPLRTLEAWEQGRHKPADYCIGFVISMLQKRAARVLYV